METVGDHYEIQGKAACVLVVLSDYVYVHLLHMYIRIVELFLINLTLNNIMQGLLYF